MPKSLFRSAAGLSVGLLYLAGCASLPEEGRQELLQAHQSYEQGNFAGAETASDRVISRYPSAIEIAEAYYLRGMARVRRGRTAQAQADFRQALKHCRRTDLQAQAAIALAMILQQDGAYAEAAPYYQGAADRLQPGDLLAETHYNLGLCRERAGQWPAARQAFKRMIHEYPSGPYTAQARRHLAWPGDHFAVQCGVFSNPANAARLLGQLRGQGFDAYLEPHTGSRPSGSAGRVGRFPDYAAAKRALPLVRGPVSDAYIVP